MSKEPHGQVYVACVPHVPSLAMIARNENAEFWDAYDARVAELRAFDPELIIAFGADHYSNIHLNLAPAFLIGHAAKAINDCGGTPGRLNVPMDLSEALASALIEQEFDVAVSYDMSVDHGFSNALGNFTGGRLDRFPVIPLHINALNTPRPTMRRCRLLGEAVGRWAATLGKRVAFIGSGGLSHETASVFPQYHGAPDEKFRDYIVRGGDEARKQEWQDGITAMMVNFTTRMANEPRGPTSVRPDWDQAFLDVVASGDLARLDSWTEQAIVERGGSGASEARLWLAALAAGRAAGAKTTGVDYYSGATSLGVGAGVVHATQDEARA